MFEQIINYSEQAQFLVQFEISDPHRNEIEIVKINADINGNQDFDKELCIKDFSTKEMERIETLTKDLFF